MAVRKTNARATSAANPKRREPKFIIGSFALETLTTGMYVEPRDCIREYVQNAFDAITTARHSKILGPHEGSIKIVLSNEGDGTLEIRDDGISLPSEQAWETLTSVGASKKSRDRHAGFRGIGRLAGVAYCDRLEFICKAQGETVSTVVTFNAKKIREQLASLTSSDLQDLFKGHITTSSHNDQPEEDHYTIVRMAGLREAPAELTRIDDLSEYLQATAPVDFRPGLSYIGDIKLAAEKANSSIPTTRVTIGPSVDEQQPILKPYGPSTRVNKRTYTINRICIIEGGVIPGGRWWGWYADLPATASGQIYDDDVAGIRLRVRNIQLGGRDTLSQIFAAVAPSYRRFWNWYIGEIYVDVTSPDLVPNARRDGFEHSEGWTALRTSLIDTLRPLIKRAYDRSDGKKTFDGIYSAASEQLDELERALPIAQPAGKAAGQPEADKSADAERSVKKASIATSIRNLYKKLEQVSTDQLSEEQQEKVREAKARIRKIAEHAAISIKPASNTEKMVDDIPHKGIYDAVLEVLEPLLDVRTFNKAKRALHTRFKNL